MTVPVPQSHVPSSPVHIHNLPPACRTSTPSLRTDIVASRGRECHQAFLSDAVGEERSPGGTVEHLRTERRMLLPAWAVRHADVSAQCPETECTQRAQCSGEASCHPATPWRCRASPLQSADRVSSPGHGADDPFSWPVGLECTRRARSTDERKPELKPGLMRTTPAKVVHPVLPLARRSKIKHLGAIRLRNQIKQRRARLVRRLRWHRLESCSTPGPLHPHGPRHLSLSVATCHTFVRETWSFPRCGISSSSGVMLF